MALNRSTGQQVWATNLKGSDFVNVVVQDGKVLASCYGEIFCLDPLTGNARWHNPLKRFGRGLATIAAEQNQGLRASARPRELACAHLIFFRPNRRYHLSSGSYVPGCIGLRAGA